MTQDDPSRFARVRLPQDGSDDSPTAHVERMPSNSLHLSLEEWPRLPFTARIERYTCSFQARSLSLQGWGLIDLPLRAAFSPAHPRARRDVPLARRGPSILSTSR